ncbi:unnamed protein product [Ixodes pacificus]
MTLWLLGNQESYRGVTDRFGVHKNTLHFVVSEIVLWPTQLAQVASHFERNWRLPGVVGAVDGCHVSTKAPEEEKSAFYNRREFHSVVLQGCCDSSIVFTHVNVGPRAG